MSVIRSVLLAAFVLGLGLSITLSQTALTLLSLLWLWRLRESQVRRTAPWPLWGPVLAFSAVSLVSALSSGQARTSVVASKGLLLVAALYVTADALTEARAAERFVSALVLVGAIAAVIGLVQVSVCPGPAPDYGPPALLYHRCFRARGPFSIYMTLAGVLNLILLSSMPRLIPGSAFKWSLVPFWLVMTCGLLATYTRGAWVGFASGAVALLPTSRRMRWILVGSLLVLAAGALVAPQHLRERFLSIGDPDDPTVRERIHMWRSGVAMWREHPWLGVGPGGVKREYPHYALPEATKKGTSHLHNTPLQILVERGAAGLAAWLWIWAAFYAGAVGRIRRLSVEAVSERALVAGSVAAITGFLVSGLFEYNFGDSEVVMIAWAIMALPLSIERRHAAEPMSGGPMKS